MVLRDPHQPTLAVRRAALASVAAAAALEVVLLASGLVPVLRAASPWSGHAFGAFAGLGALAVALLALPTWVRATVHGGPAPAPVHAVRAILAGTRGTLAGVSLAVAGCLVAALVRAPALTWDVTLASLLGALGGLGALVALCARLGRTARRSWHVPLAAMDAPSGLPSTRYTTRHSTRYITRPSARPDVLDDLATLLARWWPGSVAARLAAWFVRGLDRWTWSPRRHRTAFVGAAATVAGGTWTLWHVVRGPWMSPLPPMAYASLTAVVVAGALAASITWLGLLRPAAGNAPLG